jgi:hypothetical protein
VLEPAEQFLFVGGDVGFWIYRESGSEFALFPSQTQSNLPIYSLQLVKSSFNFTASTDTIPLPDRTQLLGHTTLVSVTSTAEFTLGFAPTIALPNVDGLVVVLVNDGQFRLTLQPDLLFSTGLLIEAPYVTLAPRDAIWFVSHGADRTWKQMSPISPLYASNAYSSHGGGNAGTGRRVETTTDAAPSTHIIYQVDVQNSGVASGTVVKFDITAQSQAGVNWAAWLDNVFGSDTSGNSVLVKSVGIGSGPGNTVPLGWDFQVDPTGTVPFAHFYVQGDASANPVTFVINPTHRDPASG